MIVRSEHPGDREEIRNIHLAAFETEVEANLVDALRASGADVISMVAEEDEEIMGHILFSPVAIEGKVGGKMMGLAPMAVVPGRQRQGIGAQLVTAGLKACERAGYEAVVVLGHPEYYPRFGFIPAERYGMKCEYDVPAEVFMVKELRKGALEGITGTVTYHKAFRDAE